MGDDWSGMVGRREEGIFIISKWKFALTSKDYPISFQGDRQEGEVLPFLPSQFQMVWDHSAGRSFTEQRCDTMVNI